MASASTPRIAPLTARSDSVLWRRGSVSSAGASIFKPVSAGAPGCLLRYRSPPKSVSQTLRSRRSGSFAFRRFELHFRHDLFFALGNVFDIGGGAEADV